jgi:hypothetical protein
MHYRSLIIALAFLPLLAGCNRSSDQNAAAKPPVELLGNPALSAPEARPGNAEISPEDAASAGAVLIFARDVCQIPKNDFDGLAHYFSGAIGENMQLKAAFVAGAKSASVVREDSAKKNELDKLKSMACPGVQRTLAALSVAKQG